MHINASMDLPCMALLPRTCFCKQQHSKNQQQTFALLLLFVLLNANSQYHVSVQSRQMRLCMQVLMRKAL